MIRREFLLAGLLAAAAATAGASLQQQHPRAVNKLCPVMPGRKIDPGNTVVYKGRVVALCCTDCIDKWNKNPAAFAGNVKEDADEGPDGLPNLKDAIAGAKAGPYPLAIFYGDGGPRTKAFLKLLSEPEISEPLGSCAFVRADPKRDVAELKGFKPSGLPCLSLYDPKTEPPALIKHVPLGAPKAVLKELQEAVKKVRGE
jgi:hypothetical protein